jgi:hypothetical protein
MPRAKIFSWSVVAALSLSAPTTPAQTTPQQSPSVAKARACLSRLYDAGTKARLESDLENGEVVILNRTRDELLPLLAGASACMNDAFPKREVVKNPATKTSSRVWYDSAEGQYVWCATNSLDDKAEQIDVLGGAGAARNWFAITFRCAAGEKILGFYAP